MIRTIIGLFAKPPTDPEITSTTGNGNSNQSIQVEETQELIDGTAVYGGEAANVGLETKDVPVIDPADDSITKEPRDVDVREYCEWLAVPKADVPFVAVDRQADWALRALGRMSGGWVDAAHYDLDAFTEHLINERNATLTHVIGSDGEASIALHREKTGADQDVLERALATQKAQVGFEFAREDGRHYHGTVAASGYCALYAGGGTPESLAGFIRDELIDYAFIPKDGTAVGKDGDAVVTECEECGREPEKDLEEVDGEKLCVVCADKREDEQEQAAVEKLDGLDTVTVTDGGQDDA